MVYTTSTPQQYIHVSPTGTGSGVGAYITEAVRDEFGARSMMVNAVVWPFAVGEVILQNYNALLTLSSLVHASDAIIVMENDALHGVCRQRLQLAAPSFEDINAVLARTLASVLVPTHVTGVSQVHIYTWLRPHIRKDTSV